METHPVAHVQIHMSRTKHMVLFLDLTGLSASRKTCILANTESSIYNIYKCKELLFWGNTSGVVQV